MLRIQMIDESKPWWLMILTVACPTLPLCLSLSFTEKCRFNFWSSCRRNVTLLIDLHTLQRRLVYIHTHTQTYLHRPGYSLFHADVHLHTHTHTHTHHLPVLWNRRAQVQTNIQATLSLSLSPTVESGFCPTHTHTHTHTLFLSAERLKCHMAGWLESERPAEKEGEVMKGWTGETILLPVLCVGTVADSSVRGPQCRLLCQLLCESGSTPAHFFPLTTVSVCISLARFPSALQSFYLSTSHSIRPSHLHSWKWVIHPHLPPNVTIKLESVYFWC